MGLSITGPIKVACSKKGAVKFMRLRFTLYAPKLHVDYEERSSGGLWINLDHAGIFNVLRSTNTRAFSFLASIRQERAIISDVCSCTFLATTNLNKAS